MACPDLALVIAHRNIALQVAALAHAGGSSSSNGVMGVRPTARQRIFWSRRLAYASDIDMPGITSITSYRRGTL